MPQALTPRTTASICAGLLIVFGALSYSAALSKSATYDETVHIPAASTHLRDGDFRANPEHPPLWKYFAALPGLVHPMQNGMDYPSWPLILKEHPNQWSWAISTLYRTPGNDANAIVNAMRFMMMLLAVSLGAVLAWWSWKVASGVGAIVAASLFAFDPNFLAHSSLVTNDVVFSLIMLGLMYVVWRVGERATWPRVIGVALLCAIGVTTKFSGLLLGPMLVLALLARSQLPDQWMFLGRSLNTRAGRLAAALALSFFTAIVCFGVIWAAYLFRFAPTPQGAIFDVEEVIAKDRVTDILSRHPDAPIRPEEVAQWHPGFVTGAAIWAERYRLLPQAFLYGIIYVHAASLARKSYLLGHVSAVGWWYYFPLAMLFKTALATLIAMATAAIQFFFPVKVAGTGTITSSMGRRWLGICLVLPVALYGLYAMTSNLNLGIRHMLPVYPFLYVDVALMADRAWQRWGGRIRYIFALLLLGLAIESLAAFPDYIPFFNVAAGGQHRGVYLLGDSNLDWGQDLKLLAQFYAEWHATNPTRKLYLRYFGTADPAAYGIQYVNLPDGYHYGPPPQWPDAPGIVAISATDLQGIYDSPEIYNQYEPYRSAAPITVLGGSIYIFPYPLPRH